MSTVTVDISNGIATITFNRPKALNAITGEDYAAFANALRDIDKKQDVIATVWQATGNWFCAGTDVNSRGSRGLEEHTVRSAFLGMVGDANTDVTKALYDHSKILVAALNGPVMGIAAAFLGQFDFIYAMPNAWLSTPFSFLGIISEAGSSVSFINRMGIARANEVLIWGQKKTAQELLECGFINKLFPHTSAEKFHSAVREHLLGEMDQLVPDAVLGVKKLLRAGLKEKNDSDAVNIRESYAQAERFVTGVPQERFMKVAMKEIRHKL